LTLYFITLLLVHFPNRTSTILIIKWRDLSGHEKTTTCKSYNCWDSKYPRVHQQLSQELILLLLL